MTISHGYAKTGVKRNKTYMTWLAMMDRCFCPTNGKYPRYGGRGITVCKRWLGPTGFSNFLADMGERPGSKTIDRIDNDGNYEPDNCRWATTAEQAMNKSNSLFITYQGKTLSVTAWAAVVGISYDLIHSRLKKGWPLKYVLSSARQNPGPRVEWKRDSEASLPILSHYDSEIARLKKENETLKDAMENLETQIVVCNTIDQTAKKVMIRIIRGTECVPPRGRL